MSTGKSEYRQALGAFLTGVTIVTTLDETNAPWGVTANSFTSVSLDPQIILVCLGRHGRAAPAFAATSRFAVNILAMDQQALAGYFASSTENRFTGTEWTRHGESGPILPGSAAWLDCPVRQRIEAADHVILFGDVLAFDHTPHPPLGYQRGRFVAAHPVETVHA